MNRILYLLTITLILISCGNNTKENDLDNQNINGKVKEIIDSTFYAEVVFGEPQKDRVKALNKISFNENGNMTEANIYNRDGSLFVKFKYDYDNKNNLIQLKRYNEEGKELTKRQFKTNEDGNIIEEIEYQRASIEHSKATELVEKKTFIYDTYGNKVKITRYEDQDEDEEPFTFEFKYTFDKHKNWISKIQYDNDNAEYISERTLIYYK